MLLIRSFVLKGTLKLSKEILKVIAAQVNRPIPMTVGGQLPEIFSYMAITLKLLKILT